MVKAVPGSGNTPVNYVPGSEEGGSRTSGRVSITEGQQYFKQVDQFEDPLPSKPFSRRNAKRYKQMPPSLLLKRPKLDQAKVHFSKQFYQDTLQRADTTNNKIQQLKAKHISKDALGAHKKWTSDQLETCKRDCYQATQELKAELQVLINNEEGSHPTNTGSVQSVAKLSLRVFWLQDQILSQTRPKRITQTLPEGIEKGLKTKQKKKKNDIRQMEMSGKDKLVAFNTGISGFSGLLTSTRLFLASLPDGMTKSEFNVQLVQSVKASDKERVMHQGEYPQVAMKTELLRKVTTKMNNLKKCLGEDDRIKLNSLYEGASAKIGGIDFIGHADGKVADDFIYTRDVINQLQQHLLKLQHFAEELGVKYGLDAEYF
ncbi:hypothetical protein [Kistimonas asteriae]|uniref:hypothetical protein n=1 Tax=Kistimonas asteriae TaxID=517724 RepID=UPI001BAB0E2A|nr:hypothetical protein [Kistimonas asteriae]